MAKFPKICEDIFEVLPPLISQNYGQTNGPFMSTSAAFAQNIDISTILAHFRDSQVLMMTKLVFNKSEINPSGQSFSSLLVLLGIRSAALSKLAILVLGWLSQVANRKKVRAYYSPWIVLWYTVSRAIVTSKLCA